MLCDFAVKLTLSPGSMNREDIDALQSAGLSVSQITVAVQVIGYFNYINRVADSLDVQIESWMEETSKADWLAGKGKFGGPAKDC